jgi:PAS domain S-box-containing protein
MAPTPQSIEPERRLRVYEAIFSNTSDLLCVFDAHGRVTYASKTLLAVWNRTRAEAVGKFWLEIAHSSDDAAALHNEVRQAVVSRQAVRGTNSFGSSDARSFDHVFAPVFNGVGEVEAVAGTARDVTPAKEAEQALREMSESKRRFISLFAHELHNSLEPLVSGLHVLRIGGRGQTDTEALRLTMERQVSQLVRVVDDLLGTYSKDRAGQVTKKRAPKR